MHTKWEYALNNWLAFVDSTETGASATETLIAILPMPFLSAHHLVQYKDVPHCHWLHEDWSILLLGTTVIREDFLTIWLDDPIRAINDCPDKFVIIAVDRVHHRCWLGRDAMGFQNAYWARKSKAFWYGASLRICQCSLSHTARLAMEHLFWNIYLFDIPMLLEPCTKIDFL